MTEKLERIKGHLEAWLKDATLVIKTDGARVRLGMLHVTRDTPDDKPRHDHTRTAMALLDLGRLELIAKGIADLIEWAKSPQHKDADMTITIGPHGDYRRSIYPVDEPCPDHPLEVLAAGGMIPGWPRDPSQEAKLPIE